MKKIIALPLLIAWHLLSGALMAVHQVRQSRCLACRAFFKGQEFMDNHFIEDEL